MIPTIVSSHIEFIMWCDVRVTIAFSATLQRVPPMAAGYREQPSLFSSQTLSSHGFPISQNNPTRIPSSSKIDSPNFTTLSKASELLNSSFEKDAQMVPDMKDILPGKFKLGETMNYSNTAFTL